LNVPAGVTADIVPAVVPPPGEATLTLDVGDTHTNVATVVATDDEDTTDEESDDHSVGAANVLPVHAAVGPGSGWASLAFAAGHTGAGHLGAAGADEEASAALRLDGRDLGFLAGLARGRATLCKIDTEGFEAEVLETLAAAGLVPLVDAFWVEVDDALLGRYGAGTADLYARMAALGFVPRVGAGAAAHYDELFARPGAGWVPEALAAVAAAALPIAAE
jgi:hypothetical protein